MLFNSVHSLQLPSEEVLTLPIQHPPPKKPCSIDAAPLSPNTFISTSNIDNVSHSPSCHPLSHPWSPCSTGHLYVTHLPSPCNVDAPLCLLTKHPHHCTHLSPRFPHTATSSSNPISPCSTVIACPITQLHPPCTSMTPCLGGGHYPIIQLLSPSF